MEFTIAQKQRAASLTVLRKELGVTLERLAELTGYAYATVGTVLRGKYHFIPVRVDDIMDAIETALNQVAAEQAAQDGEAENV